MIEPYQESDVSLVRLNPETMKWDPNEECSEMYTFGICYEFVYLSDGRWHGWKVFRNGGLTKRVQLSLEEAAEKASMFFKKKHEEGK